MTDITDIIRGKIAVSTPILQNDGLVLNRNNRKPEEVLSPESVAINRTSTTSVVVLVLLCPLFWSFSTNTTLSWPLLLFSISFRFWRYLKSIFSKSQKRAIWLLHFLIILRNFRFDKCFTFSRLHLGVMRWILWSHKIILVSQSFYLQD